MSIESAQACIERMRTDKDFARKVSECPTPESLLAYALALGYDFTYEEYQEAAGELSDDALDHVSGGRRVDLTIA